MTPTPRFVRLVLAAVTSLSAWAQATLRIDEIRLEAGDRLEVRFVADPLSYYRVLRSDDLSGAMTPVEVRLAGPVSVAAPAQAGFFRLEQVPRNVPLDSDGDGRHDLAELLGGSDPLHRDPVLLTVTQFASSPAQGDDGVSVNRETILRFNRPLAEASSLEARTFYAEAGGRRILTRSELSPDRRTATLFYLEPLPGGTQVRVVFDGNRVRDLGNQLVDADRDNEAGGVGVITFTTLNNLPVPGTVVLGRVFASELVAGPGPGTNTVNRPLAGVTITVDGMEETLRATTDAQGSFALSNAPAGRFFVHVDGRTSAGSQWPGGSYHPVVGKAWEAVAGRTNNLAGGTGEIYLPLIRAGTLQQVSAVAPTAVTFPAEVVVANPTLAGVQIVIPPGALFDDNGVRGGRVGIAPVAPDRLPEPLPDGLAFPLVITIQTDGPLNFAQPVPVRFPNLPDPVTGVRLPPGAKTALWSFNHDQGYWDVVGPATVTADGLFVETDPGVGVLQPGWHGVQPGTSLDGGPIEADCEDVGCVMGPVAVTRLGGGRFRFELEPEAHTPGIVNWYASGAGDAQGLSGNLVEFTFCEGGTFQVTAELSPKCGDTCSKTVSVTVAAEELVGACDPGTLTGTPPAVIKTGELLKLGLIFTDDPPRDRAVTWTAEGGSPASGRGLDFRTFFCAPGPHRIRWTRENPCDKACFDEVTVNVEPNPVSLAPIEFNFGDPLPARGSVTNHLLAFGALASGGGVAHWEYPGGRGLPEYDGGPVNILGDLESERQAGQGIQYDKPGRYVVRARFTNRCGETAEQSLPVEITEPACAIGEFEDFHGTFGKLRAGDYVAVIATVSTLGTARWEMDGAILDSRALAIGGPAEVFVGREDLRSFGKLLVTQARLLPAAGTYVLKLMFTTTGGQECTRSMTFNVGPGLKPTSEPPAAMSIRSILAGKIDSGETAGGGWAGREAGHPAAPERASVEPRGRTALPAAGDPAATAQHGLHYYVIVDRVSGRVVRRGRTGSAGVAHPRPLILGALRGLRETVLQAETYWMGAQEFVTGGNGSRLTLPAFVLAPPPTADTDGDGLPDAAEFVVNSDPTKADTDGDGVRDGEEVRAGTPVNGTADEPLGVVAVADTPGYAWDLALAGNLVAVADDTGGVSVFNVLNPEVPALVGRRSLPGAATSIAASGNRLLVGMGAQGVAIVDLGTLPRLDGVNLVPFDVAVTSVAAAGDLGFVGLASGRIALVELGTGTRIGRGSFASRPVDDLRVAGDRLFALAAGAPGDLSRIGAFSFEGGRLTSLAGTTFPGQRGGGNRRLRLGVAGNQIHAVHTAGLAVFEVLPSELRLLVQHQDGQLGWRQLIPDGAGRGIAAADPVSTDDGAHDLQVFDLQPNGTGLRFETQHPTPGSAEALVLAGNHALVADGSAGLVVVRHQVSDRLGRAPVVRLQSPFPDGLAEEGRLATFLAEASDDVGVARVEFFLDGQPATVDGVAPYELRITLPRRSPERTQIRIRARATDTGGNSAQSEELVLQLTPDATPPGVVQFLPANGTISEGEPIGTVGVILGEPVNPSTLTEALLLVNEAGPDRQHGTADDVVIGRGATSYRPGLPGLSMELTPGLPVGRYRARLLPGLADPAGNAMTVTQTWTFEVRAARLLTFQPVRNGRSAGRSIEAVFSGPMSPASVAAGFKVSGAGPDGQLGTADDVRMPTALVMPAGTTLARLEFNPGLPSGGYRARIEGTVTDALGNPLGTATTWDFTVAQATVGTGTVTLSGSLPRDPDVDEYLLNVERGESLAVVNPDDAEITLVRPDGEVVMRDDRDFFKTPPVGLGPVFLRVARSDGSYTLTLNRFSTRFFDGVLAGTLPQEFAGAQPSAIGDVEVFRLKAEPGATYELLALETDKPDPHRWTIQTGQSPPLVRDEITSRTGTLRVTAEGSVIEVRFEALQNNRRVRFRVTRLNP